MEESVFFDNVRGLFALIDRGIYNLITLFYNTLMDLANLQIIDNLHLDEFVTRIYGFVGIIMFFKVSFSIIEYIVNPDMMIDNTKGAGKLIQRVLIVFVLVIAVPFCFDFLYNTQSAILEESVIPKLILGTDSGGNSTNYSTETISLIMDDEYCNDDGGTIYANPEGAAEYVALATFRPFFQIDDNHDSKYFENDAAVMRAYCGTTSVNQLLKSKYVYAAPYKKRTNSQTYVVDYNILVSTIVGIVVALLFLGFCFDAAARTIKLLFLEIFAPVAIISYVDPNSSKNGMFRKWFTEVKNTWLSLFLRLAAVFFAIYLITMFNNANTGNIWLTLFVIIGALIFAKQLPKFVENLLGIKLDGALTLNPLKKLGKEMYGADKIGKLATGIGSMGLSAFGAGYGAFRARHQFNKEQKELDAKLRDKQKLLDDQLNRYNAARQRIIDNREQAFKNARFTSDYDRANQIYKQQMSNFDKNYRSKMDDLYNQKIKNIEDNQRDKADKIKKFNENFSNRHPVGAAAMQVLRGTKFGFQKGAKNPSDVIKNSVDAAKMAAKEKNQHDIFDTRRRIDDFLTDVGGVKNSSGTTSMYKKEIKETNERLKDIGNYMSQLNTSFAGIIQKAPGAISYVKDNKGNTVMATRDDFDYTTAGISRESIDSMISELRGLREDEKAANKRLAELTDATTKDKK